MDRFETEDQQVEAIKQFWKDNGVAIVVGVLLGIGGLWGWRAYSDSVITAKETASTAYQESLELLIEKEDNSKLDALLLERSDSVYAQLASLVKAQQAAEKENYDEAVSALTNVSTSESELADIAYLRLAQIFYQQAKFDQALESLEKIVAPAFDDQKFELKGDTLYALAQFDEAEEAYNQALTELPGDPNIQMKLDNIAYARTASAAPAIEEVSTQGE